MRQFDGKAYQRPANMKAGKLFKPRAEAKVAMIFRAAYGEAYDGNPWMGGLRRRSIVAISR